MNVPYDTRLPPELRALKVEIEAHARAYGLDFYETIFEVVDADDLNEIASYGGFPTRYPHWSFGMAYEELKKGYDYGLSKIYEMVINNDPCYAYLMRCNHTVDQKLVMAHVYGHCDFFKNNAYFAHTSRKMMDEMANHGVRIRRYAEKHGEDQVESFIDRCMSIDDLIDVHSTAIKRREDVSRYDFREPEDEGQKLTRFKSKDYMSDYINPPGALKAEEDERKKKQQAIERSFPERPEKDVLLFLIEHAPLKPWQRDVLSIIRDEAYYFAPQGQTKTINEGWASFWHSTIMTERALEPWECVDYADHHSGTMAVSRGRMNPYKLGIELLRNIEMRWNTGRFGKEYDECDDLDKRRSWNKELGLGRKKIFEVRRVHNDITLIDTFLTPEFCAAPDVLIRLRGARRQLRHRVARVPEDQGTTAVQPDQLRQAVHLRGRRQLPQPRRVAVAARIQRHRSAARPGGRHARQRPGRVGPTGTPADRGGEATKPDDLRR